MDKRASEFPASAALHGGHYVDRTLRQFDERRIADPDAKTAFEGTVYALPAMDPGILAGQLALQESSRFTPTDEPLAVAMAPRRARARQVKIAIERKRKFLAQFAR